MTSFAGVVEENALLNVSNSSHMRVLYTSTLRYLWTATGHLNPDCIEARMSYASHSLDVLITYSCEFCRFSPLNSLVWSRIFDLSQALDMSKTI